MTGEPWLYPKTVVALCRMIDSDVTTTAVYNALGDEIQVLVERGDRRETARITNAIATTDGAVDELLRATIARLYPEKKT